MSVRDEVRRTQQDLAALDAAHSRATARLDRATTRRAEVLAEADRAVIAAREGVDRAVATMADGLGAELTAQVLGVETAEVRRIAKAAHGSREGNGAGGSKGRR